MSLTLILNGLHRHFDDLSPGSTLSELVAALELKQDRVALEYNGAIASRKDWSTVSLHNDDKIELVHFVGGGIYT